MQYLLLLTLFLPLAGLSQSTPFDNFNKSDSVYAFAPELSIAGNTYKGSFSNDFNTFYFLRKADEYSESYVPYSSVFSDGKWQDPQVMDYYDSSFSYTYQAIIPGTNQLVFCANMPQGKDQSKQPNYSLWSIDLLDTAAKPIGIGPSNLLSKYNAQPSITKNGTIYFMSIDENWRGRTAYYMLPGDDLALPLNVVNNWQNDTSKIVGNFSMHPDGKYMVVCIRTIEGEQFGLFDLFISYNNNNTWSEPRRLGLKGMNTKQNEAFPYLTHDGRFLLFTRDMNQFFIVSTNLFMSENR